MNEPGNNRNLARLLLFLLEIDSEIRGLQMNFIFSRIGSGHCCLDWFDYCCLLGWI